MEYDTRVLYKWNRIGFQGFMQKILTPRVAIKIKRISFRFTIIAAAALSERENVETYLSIVNEKLLSLRCGMMVVSLQYNHPWQIHRECNDRYVFNNKDSSRSFKLILLRENCSSILFFYHRRIELSVNHTKFILNYLYRKMQNWKINEIANNVIRVLLNPLQ